MKKIYIAFYYLSPGSYKNFFLFLLFIAGMLMVSKGQSPYYTDYAFQQQNPAIQKSPFDPSSPVFGIESATLDANPPVITYTALPNTCNSSARVLTATITDVDGVPISGSGLPVLYWKINSAIQTPIQGVFAGSNQYNFTFGGGAPPGSLVSYYVVAQDNAATPHVIAKPSAGAGGYTASPPAAATEPTTQDFYVVQNTLAAGTYTVGAGGAQNYLTITDAVNAYNNSCLSGAVTFLLMDANYGPAEVFPLTIFNAQASASNTLTIKPNTAVNTTLTGSSADAIFKLNGADYTTIDGSNSGGTTRNLTLVNTNAGLLSSVVWVGSSSAANPATNNAIKNCNIYGNTSTTTYAGIVSSSGINLGAVAEAANSNNTYRNNNINTTYYGIDIVGPAVTEAGTVIAGNIVGSTVSSKKLGYRGIYVSNQANMSVSNNTVAGVSSTFGLLSETDPTAGIIASGAITGGNINANIINDIRNTNTTGWHAHGITLQSTTLNTSLKIYNNWIYNVQGNGKSTAVTDNGHGIAIQTGGGYGIYFNSISFVLPQATPGITACIFIGAGVTSTATLDIRNNILSNRRPNGNGVRYSIYCSVPNAVFSNINYNDYYSLGPLGYLGGVQATIGAWQAATGADGNSTSADPIFVNPNSPGTDLHLQPISPLNDLGTPIAGITTDIDGVVVRNPVTPDIGSHEFTPPNCSANSGGTASSTNTSLCVSGSVILSASGFSYGLGITYQWESSPNNSTWSPIPGETNPTSANPPAISSLTYYRLKVICSLTGGVPGYSNTITVTVNNPSVLTTTPASRCGNGYVVLGATSTPGTVVNWYSVPTGGVSLYTGNSFTTPVISSTTTFYAEAAYPGSSGSVGAVSPTSEGGAISTQYTSWEVFFDVLQATQLLTVDVYPLASGETSTLTVNNSVGTVLQTITYITTVSGGATAQTIPVNVQLSAGTGYYLYTTNADNGLPPSGLSRNISNGAYPYTSTDINIVGNGFLNTSYYMCYYNWKFSNGCASVRTPVAASIITPPSISLTATPQTLCLGASTTLTASSSNASYVFTWTPGSVVAPSITVSPTSNTKYVVNAFDGSCASKDSITITVISSPAVVTSTPAAATKCTTDAAIPLTASGGATSVSLLNENFNGGTTPAGWVVSGGTSVTQWTLRPDGYIPPADGSVIHSNDSTQFYMSNTDGAGNTLANLRSPAFSTMGITAASINFYHYYSYFGFNIPDSASVDASVNGTSWSNLRSWRASVGGPTSWAFATIPLTAAFLGKPTVYIRFRYAANNSFWWAVDNVTVTGNNQPSPFTWSPIGGLYTNSASTIAYTGTALATVYASPGTTTTYTAIATGPNGCTRTSDVLITVRPAVTASITASPNMACPNQNVTISIALTGTAPWSLTYTNGTPVTVNNILTSPYTFVVNPPATTTYSITALSDAYCVAPAANYAGTAPIIVSTVAFSTWLGYSSDWTDGNNWCGGVPTSSKDVTIPGSVSFYPIITGTTAVSKNLSISAGANVTITSTGALSITGSVTNNGIITNAGIFRLNGTIAQSFPGGSGSIAAMNILDVNKPSGIATFDKSFTVTGELRPTAGAITLNNDTVTIKSTAVSTARVSSLGASASFAYTGTGKFSIERYIASTTQPAWRFLAAPIGGLQTMHEAWQENQPAGSAVSNGYGMQIIGPSSAGSGFDLNNAITSVKTYNPATNLWVTVAGTNNPISSPEGYMSFVRGDRGQATFGSMSATTLRTAGPIKTGTIGPIIIGTNQFGSIANPYPSAIDFSAITKTGLQDVYYMWDPTLGTSGGYVTFVGPGYAPIPASGSYINGNKFIESGQAFFVHATTGATPHNISIGEASKVAGSNLVTRTGITGSQLRTNLSATGGNTPVLIDGTLIEFGSGYSNMIDDLDAVKLSNFGENIGISSAGKTLVVERRAEIVTTDTIFYTLGQLSQRPYQFEFVAENLDHPGLVGFLEDNYLQNSTPLNLSGTTVVNFAINSDPASFIANRFRIVFRQLSPVPVSITKVTAQWQDEDAVISWQVENEFNVDHYAVERSADGRNFSQIATQVAFGNGTTANRYNNLDKEPFKGNNFYRIQSVDIGGSFKYSEVVKLTRNAGNESIVVYPNPVEDGRIGLLLSDQPEGLYRVKLFAANGQEMFSQTFYFSGGTGKIALPVKRHMADGIYRLDIRKPDENTIVEKLLFH